MTEPVVLLPAMMCDARLFQAQITPLSRQRPVMVAPISGAERIDEIASTLLDMLPHKFALAGHSMGGIVALELLRRAPNRVTRLALMATSPLGETPQTSAAYEPLIVAARAGRLDQALEGVVPRAALAPGPGRVAVLGQFHAMAHDAGAGQFVAQLRALQRRRDQQSTLRRCKVLTTIICGAHDTVTPPRRHALMAGLVPCSRLEVIEQAGHFMPLEAPDALNQILQNWLAQPYVLQDRQA